MNEPDKWFPICEHCDDDATHLAPPQDNPWWLFTCDRHSRLGDRTIQQVRDGLRPQVQDQAWAAARAAIQGVVKPTDEELSFYERG